jgi:photosynthetic reaction center cytochrome c subunit
MRRGNKSNDNTLGVWVVLLLVSGVLAIGLGSVIGQAMAATEDQDLVLNAAYLEYATEPASDYYSNESAAAIAAYIQEFPEPQNVQILQGMTTTQIWQFMLAYNSGGLKVDCTYCHNINNFAADVDDENPDAEWPARKDIARTHLEMVADLNQNWITKLGDVEAPVMPNRDIPLADIVGKQPSGAQIICATCHNGEAQPVAWPENLHALPDDYRLPLDDLNVLLITANYDVSLEAVQYNQHTMYHMSESLGVGCTHCHNSRYFPEWIPTKYYAYTMLQMNQHILENYQDSMNGQEPSCYLCHYNNVRPGGALASEAALISAGADMLGSSYEP